jgi:starvation-inducible DNA-binding protein
MTRFSSSSAVTADGRKKICSALNAALADGVDLYTQIKVAHWNIKGPNFAALHALFDTFAGDAARFNDEIAERVVTLGELAQATARHVAKTSRLAEYPQDLTRDLEHVARLVDRFATYLDGVRDARDVADDHDDQDTVDLLTEVVQVFEKHSWMLRATLEHTRAAGSDGHAAGEPEMASSGRRKR